MPRVILFEILVEDLERASKFYETVFGWQVQQAPGLPARVITTGHEEPPIPGIDGLLFLKNEIHLGPVICTIAVDSVDAYLERVMEAGGNLRVPKEEYPGFGFIAYCTDPDGNEFGVFESSSPVG